MKRLLQIELLKLRPYKAFWIMWGVYLVLLVAMAIVFKNILDEIMSETPAVKVLFGGNILSFPLVWHNIAYILSYLHLVLGILVVVMVTNEINYKTIRQSTINGLSRNEFLFSKVWTVILFSLIATVIMMVTTLLLGLLNSDEASMTGMWDKVLYVPAFFIQLVGYCTFAIFLSLLVKRAGFAIAAMFIYVFVIEETLAWQLPRITEELTYLLPVETFDKLIKSPFRAALDGDTLQQPDMLAMGLSVGYTLGFIGLSSWMLKRRDL